MNKEHGGPRGGEGLGLPSEAMLQFALLPPITGFGSTQALRADSGSRKVTYRNVITRFGSTQALGAESGAPYCITTYENVRDQI